MKRVPLLLSFVLISCTSSILLQPHIDPQDGAKVIDSDAAIFIPSEDLTGEYEKFNILLGNKVRIPFGTPLKELTQETFAPLFNRVYYTGRRDYEITPYIIEVSISDFEVTTGYDTHLVIKCSVSTSDEVMFSDEFRGSGKGSIITIGDDRFKQDQIRRSAENAFIEAFQNMQRAFIDKMNGL